MLPPPEYIIESYLIAMQMAEETDKAAKIQRALSRLRATGRATSGSNGCGSPAYEPTA